METNSNSIGVVSQTCMGLELGASGLMMRLVPVVYSTPSESGAQAAPYTGTDTCTSVDLSMPLRDQIFTRPSSPAATGQVSVYGTNVV